MQLYVEISIEVRRPADEVFDFLADAENLPRWADEFEEVVKLSDGPVAEGSRFRATLRPPTSFAGLVRGRSDLRSKRPPVTTTMWWSAFDRPRRLAASSDPIRRGPGEITTTQSFALAQREDGPTQLTAAWERDVRGVPAEKLVAPFVSRLIGREIRRAQTESLQRLKTLLEAADGSGR